MKPTFYLKIFVMICALVGVFYFIGQLKSGAVSDKLTDPESAVSLLIGGEYRPSNWCPAQTVAVEIYSPDGKMVRSLTTAADISSVCEIMMGAFSSEGIEDSSYLKRLVAKNASGEAKIMEQVPEKPIFRSQGLPFHSPMLLKSLARRVNP